MIEEEKNRKDTAADEGRKIENVYDELGEIRKERAQANKKQSVFEYYGFDDDEYATRVKEMFVCFMDKDLYTEAIDEYFGDLTPKQRAEIWAFLEARAVYSDFNKFMRKERGKDGLSGFGEFLKEVVR